MTTQSGDNVHVYGNPLSDGQDAIDPTEPALDGLPENSSFEEDTASSKITVLPVDARSESTDAFETELVEPDRQQTIRQLPTNKPWMNLVAEEDEYLGITSTGAAYSYKYRRRKGDEYMAGVSFGVWDTSSNFRQAVFVITHSHPFEMFILLSIIFQVVLMALTIAGDHAANLEKYPDLDGVLGVSEKTFLCIYTIEMGAKMLALGVYDNKHAYLRSAWNTMDVCLVGFGWVYTALKVAGLPNLINPSIVRLVRCLRPLRTLSFLKGVRAALQAWMFLADIGLLLLVALTLFGVLGVQLFGGATSYLCADSAEAASNASCPSQIVCASQACSTLPSAEVPVWGFDTFSQALLSGWIATTGDMWTPDMVEVYSLSESRYAQYAWPFFILWSMMLNLVFANLFTAVIINSFLENHKQTDDPNAVADSIKKEITLFNRIDTDLSGVIAVNELETIAAILDLDDDLFTSEELQEACQSMDATGDGTVDFEEFATFWEANSPFVVKLKKALKRQEDTIREAWDAIDEDESGLLDAGELLAMAQIMHIQLSDEEITVAMEEMDADEGEVNFSSFSNWWLSGSKIAAKVKAASKAKTHGNESSRMFTKMDKDAGGGLDVEEILSASRLAFSRVLTAEEAAQLFEEALPVGASEGSEIFIEDFETWWKSSKDLAVQLRAERSTDVIKVRGFVESLSIVERRVLSPRAMAKDASSGNALHEDELEEIICVLKLRCTVVDLVESIEATIVADNTEAEDDASFDLRASYRAATSTLGYVKPVEVSLEDYIEWMMSPENLAERAMAELDQQIAARLAALERPFPFIPGISPACRSLANSSTYDSFMILAIVLNTAFMATAHHEQEITSPKLTQFVQDSEIVFTALYVAEVIIRNLGMGFKPYMSDPSCVFDLFCTLAIFAGWIAPDAGHASSFRSLRVLVKCLRVARSATVLLRAEQVQYLLKTVMEESRDLALLGLFMVFMLVLMTVVAGHTLGSCHIHEDGTADTELPTINFFTFWQSFHANFMIMMGVRWSEIMFDYMSTEPNEHNLAETDMCARYSWVFFVMCFSVMKFFAGNLFVAMIVDGFTLSETEKLVKQEKNHLQSMAEESNILREMGMGSGFETSLGGAIDGFKAMREGGAQDLLMDGLKEVPKPSDVMKVMSQNARVKKLSGPMAQMKKEMGRQGNKLNSLADKASGGQLKKLQDEAEQRLKAVQEEIEKVAAEAKQSAVEAGSKAATMAATTTLEKLDEAKRRAEAGLAEAAAKMDEQLSNEADILSGPEKTAEELKAEASWNIFPVQNGIRQFCIRTVDHPQFEPVILTLICISGVSIAAEGPPGSQEVDNRPLLANLFHTINIGILVVFWLEFWLHTIAEGFITTPGAYLSKAWHRMDFFVLIVCSIEFVMTYVGEGDAVRILRVIRVWRPLQLLKHNDAITVLLEALANVLPVMLGVLGLMMIFYTSFAIFGTGIFMGTFASCNCDGNWALPVTNCTDPDYASLGKDSCIAQGGTWENPPYNFDSFVGSMKALFYSTTGGLKIIMLSAMDRTEVYEAPQYQASFFSAGFFWLFAIVNRYFIQNLLVGLLCNYFLQASGSSLLTSAQQQWAQCQIFVLMTPAYVKPPPEEQTLRRHVYNVVAHPWFEPAITIVVCVNVGIMFMDGVPQDVTLWQITETIQYVCMWIFTLDMVMMAFAYGWSDYWKDSWSKLDVVIVVSSWLSNIFDVQWISVLRGLRVFRILSLVKRFKNLRPIVRSLLVSLPSCLNVLGVMILFIFIFAVCAMNLYGLVPHGDTRYGINENNNFDNFPNAFLFLCQMVSGHPYIHVVYELENHAQPFPFTFFAAFTVVTQWVLINLFVVILLDNFMKCFVVSKMDITEEHVVAFKKEWSEAKTDPGGLFGGKPFTIQPECASIDVRMLEEFVPMLLPPTETLDTNLHSHKATDSLKLFHHIDISPLGLIVPHRVKHKTELAMPFEQGQVGHIDGQLVEIMDARWDSEIAREEGLPPSTVSVQWLESDEIDAKRLLADDGMHVPAVEKMVGLVDGEKYEITWVSNDRTRVRVKRPSGRKKRFASNRIEKSNGAPSWLARGLQGDSPRAGDGDEYYSPKEEQERAEASIKLQASYRGYAARKEIERQRQDAEDDQNIRLDSERVANFFSVDGGAGKMGTTETVLAIDVHRVTVEGDEFWLNRLIVELGISSQEAADGFRYLPPGVKLTDEDGRFLPVVVGLRALANGQFVQDVRVGFHELLLALCLIEMSYGGLNYEERQAKIDKLRKRGEDYAARIFQTCARCKLAKRHLVKDPSTLVDGPLRKWGKFHKTYGKFDDYSDPACVQRMIFLDAIRNALLSSMKQVFTIKANVSGHQLDG